MTSGWKTATISGLTRPTARTVRLRLDVPEREPHLPGQHYVVRLTAEDGYVAQRSYSVASAPSDPLLELLVEHVPEGEVSGWFAEVARPGDTFEVRGPIGGWFAWDGSEPGLGVGGGTGVVPLVAMLRHAFLVGQDFRVVAAARTLADLPYARELIAGGATVVLSPRGVARPSGCSAVSRRPARAGRPTGLRVRVVGLRGVRDDRPGGRRDAGEPDPRRAVRRYVVSVPTTTVASSSSSVATLAGNPAAAMRAAVVGA